ncbi:MAG: hypothetical protein GPJ54_13695 [Candidatus Heimdallarchaeota archaeon]|nr:hypothetical protein [Candidatus Heimdallarchaeota archaeon]
MTSDLELIYYTEFARSIIGFTLLLPELIRLRSSLNQKTTISMVGILIFYNLIFSTRAWGIKYDNPTFRQFAPAISALLSAIFLVTWGALVINIDKRKYNLALITIIGGIFGFILGAIINNPYLSILGIAIFALTMIIIIFNMLIFVFQKSPYLQARYRIFLMTLATIIMITFEGLGVIAMRRNDFDTAVFFFLSEIIGRILMTLSIFLPRKVKDWLSLIIK